MQKDKSMRWLELTFTEYVAEVRRIMDRNVAASNFYLESRQRNAKLRLVIHESEFMVFANICIPVHSSDPQAITSRADEVVFRYDDHEEIVRSKIRTFGVRPIPVDSIKPYEPLESA